MSARDLTRSLMMALYHRGIDVSFADANALRRAQITLQRWGEAECGDSNEYASYSVERDETTGIPYRCVYRHDSNGVKRYRIADRERGALKRVQDICKRYGLHYFHQTDPRGCSLYIEREPLPDSNYTRGIACSVN